MFCFYFYENRGDRGDRPYIAAVSYGPDKYVHLMPFTLLRFTNKTVTNIQGLAHHAARTPHKVLLASLKSLIFQQ